MMLERHHKKIVLILMAVIGLSTVTITGTLAYMLAQSNEVTNIFEPAQMSCEIQEDFSDGINKKEVKVKNTGDAPAYIRVKLLPYWYDKDTDVIIAKTAWIPVFTPEAGWILGADGYYYYSTPVQPGEFTSILIPEMALSQDEVSLARQVLEIIASCIQAEPETAVTTAWSGSNGSVTGVSNGSLTVTPKQ